MKDEFQGPPPICAQQLWPHAAGSSSPPHSAPAAAPGNETLKSNMSSGAAPRLLALRSHPFVRCLQINSDDFRIPPSNSKNSTRSRHPSPQLLPAKCPGFTCRGLICSIITIWRLYPTMKCWARRSCLIPSNRGGGWLHFGCRFSCVFDGWKKKCKRITLWHENVRKCTVEFIQRWKIWTASGISFASFKSFRWNADANSWWTNVFLHHKPTNPLCWFIVPFFSVLMYQLGLRYSGN